ncbi:hypothetical protein [Blastomonas sp. CCH1-A6]|jgi:hypothetical protein|uniref:hypothetical protein n=1 Tax=Blastomonas sp. CCH1-A6 TaxID=1768762 RepID=UPI00082D9982
MDKPRLIAAPDDIHPIIRPGALSSRARLALNGELANPVDLLAELFASDVPIERDVRDMLVRALSEQLTPAIAKGSIVASALDRAGPLMPEHRRLRVVGNIGRESEAEQYDTRKRWIELAKDFIASGLSAPEYLASGRLGILPDEVNLLDNANAFYRNFERWKSSDLVPDMPLSPWEEDDEPQMEGAFCEWVIENKLLKNRDLTTAIVRRVRG